MNEKDNRIKSARQMMVSLGLPKAQHNDRSALCLLALLDVAPDKSWGDASNLPLGITPIMNWIGEHYNRSYAPNTRETVRRQTMHQFCDAGIVICNPDNPSRAVNSPRTVYQIEPSALDLLRTFGTGQWHNNLESYLDKRKTLAESYAEHRKQKYIPVKIAPSKQLNLSAGKHSELIRAVVEDFAPRFAPGSALIYLGDTGNKWRHYNENLLTNLGVNIDPHGKMPDIVLHYVAKNWLLLIEAVTSHGPIDEKRHAELSKLFSISTACPVYITAFPDRSILGRYIGKIAWETEAWVADNPSHLIHFDGERFLAPHNGA